MVIIDDQSTKIRKKYNNFLLKETRTLPLSIRPVSSPSNHQLKNLFFYIFFISDSTVLRKMDHFIYYSSYGNLIEAGN